jgi:hypothetical protein
MRRHVLSTLRAASLAVIPPVLLVVSTGCQDESEATGPLGGRQIQVAQANRGAIPTDPMLEAVALPFRGSFTTLTTGEIVPPTLTVTGTAERTATHLGRFTATSLDIVDQPTATSTGTFNFTAANGGQSFTKTAGGQDAFTPPNVSHVTLVATIVSGTGRLAEATGTFTMQQTSIIDLATGTSSGSGSFDGTLSRGQ